MSDQQVNIPDIRFPEFKESWKQTKLNELLFEAKSRNGNLIYDKSQVLSVSGEFGIVNQIEHLGRSYAGESVHNYHIVEVGDIVYTKSPLKENPFGIIKINKSKAGIVSTLYAVYKVNRGTADGNFLDFYFSLNANTNRYLRPLVKKGSKNDMKVNNAYVLNDPIFVPQREEQKKIVEFLTAVEKKILQISRKKALLEQYKKGIMQQLFSQQIRFKDDDGTGYPNWMEKKLSEILTFFPTNSYSRSFLNYENGEVKNIHYGDVHTKFKTNFDIKKENVPFLNSEIEAGKIPFENYLKEGDLIIADASEDYKDVGKSIEVINLDNQRVVAGLHTYIGRDLNGLTYLGFKGYMMQNHEVRLQIMKMATGSSVLGITKGNLGKIKINIPSLKEQKKFVEFLTAIDVKINFIATQLKETQLFKKGLLQQMFV
jgi:type I restriction enzyme S subunit